MSDKEPEYIEGVIDETCPVVGMIPFAKYVEYYEEDANGED